MTRHLVLAVFVVSSLSFAQGVRNTRQDLRQDNRQLANDRFDAARAGQLLADYDAAMSRGDVARLASLDQAFDRHLAKEISESRVESAQDRQEVRQAKREARTDGTVRDQVNLADDRRDRANERVTRERLITIQSQLTSLAGRFDPPSVNAKRALYGEVLWFAQRENVQNVQEKKEDRRELREDRRR